MNRRGKVIQREQNIINVMICMFCHNNHETGKEELCDSCRNLRSYSYERLKNCPLLPDKPPCEKCPVHCYNKEMREKVKEIMRYSGPRMVLRHPYFALLHIWNKTKFKLSRK
ncbi:MAG: nitrous oxide-stimulated promoter family protein [Candidatus Aminicenantes bacterium]|nr:nitrous oxide-stimulated promoter family protein [Candidatus Aminicenantes bacterium]